MGVVFLISGIAGAVVAGEEDGKKLDTGREVCWAGVVGICDCGCESCSWVDRRWASWSSCWAA